MKNGKMKNNYFWKYNFYNPNDHNANGLSTIYYAVPPFSPVNTQKVSETVTRIGGTGYGLDNPQ
jgi:hypothetical protein